MKWNSTWAEFFGVGRDKPGPCNFMFLFCLLFALPALSADSPSRPVAPSPASSVALTDPKALLTGNETLEEGKALFESGQYMESLGKFMTILRRDPNNAEARQYLRMVVDVMRQSNEMNKKSGPVQDKVVQDKLREMMKKRSILTLDLKAVPGVKVNLKQGIAQIEIDSPLLFEEAGGGLKDGGIPILDRATAWLRTFGEQPIIIHCYPEELQDPSASGSRFLQRYADLYNFFVEERKLPPQRFISANALQSTAPPPALDESVHKVVIETVGSQSTLIESMPAEVPNHALSRWLEFSVTSSRQLFTPDEGEWTSIDLAALPRTSLKSWTFLIVPQAKARSGSKIQDAVFSLQGTENLLRRVSWDGRHSKTGSYVPGGVYVFSLSSTDKEGQIKTAEIQVHVARSTVSSPLDLTENKPAAEKKSTKSKSKKKAIPPVEAAESAPVPNRLPAETVVSSTAEVNVTDESQAIWKLAIEFDANSADIKDSQKGSLMRIAKTLEVYPLQKVRLLGLAEVSEAQAVNLARQRVEKVRSILLKDYQIDPARVMNAGGKTSTQPGSSKVEMSITN